MNFTIRELYGSQKINQVKRVKGRTMFRSWEGTHGSVVLRENGGEANVPAVTGVRESDGD